MQFRQNKFFDHDSRNQHCDGWEGSMECLAKLLAETEASQRSRQMAEVNTASREEWLAARLALLEQDKTLIRQRDVVSAARCDPLQVKIDEDYLFQSEKG